MRFSWPILFLLIVFTACLKQEAPSFKSEIVVSEKERNQLESCSGYRPFQNQLSKANTLKLFECNRWNEQFPKMYHQIKLMKDQNWDIVFKPIDNTFFNNKAGRIKLFKILKDLKEKNALDDLGELGEKFFKSSAPKALKDFTVEEIKIVLTLLEISEKQRKTIFDLSVLAHNFLNKQEDLIENSFYKSFKQPGINYFKNWFFSFLAQRYLDNNLEKDLEIFASMFLSSKENPNWVAKWSKDSENSYKNFVKIFEYSSLKKPQVRSDVSFLYDTLMGNVVCHNLKDKSTIYAKEEVSDIIDFLIRSEQEDFILKQIDHKTKLITFSNLCDRIEVNGKISEDFVTRYDRLFNYVQDFFQDPIQFEWIKGLHYQINQTVPDDKFYFIKFMKGDFYGKVEELTKLFNKNSEYGFYELFFNVLKTIPNEDYKKVYKAIKLFHDPKLKPVFKVLAHKFIKMRDEEKESLYEFFETAIRPGFKNKELLKNTLSVFESFEDLSSILSNHYAGEAKEESSVAIQELIEVFSEEETLEELKRFYGPKHMMKVVMALTNGLNELDVNIGSNLSQVLEEEVYIYDHSDLEIKKYNQCISDLQKLENNGARYYDLVVLYPESCKNIKNGSLTHQMFVWFNQVEKIYKETYGEKYNLFDANGIIRKESLQEIVIVLHSLSESSNQKPEILVKKISEKLIAKGFYKTIDDILALISNFYGKNDQLNKYSKYLVEKFSNTSDDRIEDFLSNSAKLLSKEKFQATRANLKDCRVLESRLGVNPCLSKEEVQVGLKKLLKILFRKFDGADPMLEELINLFHPDGGIEIPYPEKGRTAKHVISFEEVARFFYHMSKEGESKVLYMKTPSASGMYKLNTLTQLEVVIRDISFLNDFYGSYFKNTVAGAKHYQEKVKSLRKQVVLMESSGKFLRKVNVFPESSEWQLNNVLETYDSLARVDDQFEFDSNFYQYGPMMQSILALVTKTSKPEAQNFTAFWFPNERIGDVHNGLFLTEFVRMSGMQHFAQFFNNRHQGDLKKFLNQKSFRRINDELLRKTNLERLKSDFRNIVDKYASNDNGELYLAINDLVAWLYDLNDQERELVEDVLVNVLEAVTYSEKDSLHDLFPIIDFFLENYKVIKSNFPSDVKVIDLIKNVYAASKTFKNLSEANTNWINDFVKLIKISLVDNNQLGLKILKTSLVKEPKLILENIVNVLNNFTNSLDQLSDDEVKEIIEGIDKFFKNKNFNLQGLKLWANETIKEGPHENEFFRLAHFLSQTVEYKAQKRSYFYIMLDQLLVEKSKEFSDLLNTCIKAIRL